MAEKIQNTAIPRISTLNLSAEQKQQIIEVTAATTAVNVYRELQRAGQTVVGVGRHPGCSCCCSDWFEDEK